jgi:CRP-like cAMP-binding protein
MVPARTSPTPPATEDAKTALAALPLFADLDDRELEDVAAASRGRAIAAGRCAYRRGEEAEALYLLLAGRMEVVRVDGAGSEVRLGTLGPGDLFGDAALLEDRAHTSEVRAAEPSEVLMVPRRVLDALFERHPARRLRLRTLSVTRRLARVSAAFRGEPQPAD